MEQAIKRAIEGGYENLTVIEMRLAKEGLLRREVYLLDPLFWQALGKACGWGQNEVNHDVLKMKDGVCCECLKEGEYKCYFCKFTFCEEHSQTHFGSKNTQLPNCMGGKGEVTSSWVYHWHRFIDHLAEGKDVESFFNELLK